MTVQNATVPVLRYFDCRSRGQALRFALTGAGQTYEDVRVPIADLALFRNNAHRPEVGGPFAALPVLDWNGHTVAQTLAIAAYLDRALFSAQARSSEYQSWLESIINAAHLDMQAPYSAVMWLPEDCSDTQLGAASKSLFEQLTARLAQLEVLHSRADPPQTFYGGSEPVMADYFVYESLSRACLVFGDAFESRLSSAPGMARLKSELESGGTLDEALSTIPMQITASPGEITHRERLLADTRLWAND